MVAAGRRVETPSRRIATPETNVAVQREAWLTARQDGISGDVAEIIMGCHWSHSMAIRKPNPIAPFPANLDRVAFGHWIAGFTDGEGCFSLYARVAPRRDRTGQTRFNFGASYAILLRRDDIAVLETIRSYFMCGRINLRPPVRPSAKPAAAFSVRLPDQLNDIIVPHFDRFPLMAKKSRDFAIWKRGVSLLAGVTSRRRVGGYGKARGWSISKWSSVERDEFHNIVADLRQVRAYSDHHSSPLYAPPKPRIDVPAARQLSLFD